MKIIETRGNRDIALLYMAQLDNNRVVEFVESVQPPIPREQKWVLIVSTMDGCPVRCKMCDAGGWYRGRLTKNNILEQIDFLVYNSYSDGNIPVKKFKVQFARMGEPSLNPEILQVLKILRTRYMAPGLLPCISTIAPVKGESFLDQLIDIKDGFYSGGKFQMQFSIHSTDSDIRDDVIPIKKWKLKRIADYGRDFIKKGDRKIALNFALAEELTIDPEVLRDTFDPDIFMIKVTPVNPTHNSLHNGITNRLDCHFNEDGDELVASLRSYGFDVLVSIGELEENEIGSNCGQFVGQYREKTEPKPTIMA